MNSVSAETGNHVISRTHRTFDACGINLFENADVPVPPFALYSVEVNGITLGDDCVEKSLYHTCFRCEGETGKSVIWLFFLR